MSLCGLLLLGLWLCFLQYLGTYNAFRQRSVEVCSSHATAMMDAVFRNPTPELFSVTQNGIHLKAKNIYFCRTFEVLTALNVFWWSFWFLTLHGLVGWYQCFGESYCLFLQGWVFGGEFFLKMYRTLSKLRSHILWNTMFITVCHRFLAEPWDSNMHPSKLFLKDPF